MMSTKEIQKQLFADSPGKQMYWNPFLMQLQAQRNKIRIRSERRNK